MKQRASSLVSLLFAFAALVGFTSAVRDHDLVSSAATDNRTGAPTANRAGAAGIGEETALGNDTSATGTGGAPIGETQVANGGAGASGSLSGPGTPIKVAYIVPDNSAAGSFGINAQNADDGTAEDREFRALIDSVNASGGIAGHPIQAQRFTVDLTKQLDENSLIQICVQITEDYGAAYVVDTHVMGYPSTQRCFAQHGVPLIGLSFGVDDQFQRSVVPYFATTLPTIDTIFRAAVPQLQTDGYLPNAKVGVFLNNDPFLDGPYQQILLPALQQAGAAPVAVAHAGPNDEAAISNAVLTFRSKGVTHVIFMGSILHIAAFANVAESQGYRPRYAFTDYYSVNVTAPLVAPAAQMNNAVTVSALFEVITEDASRAAGDLSTPYNRDQVQPGFARCLDTLSDVRKTNYWKPAEAGASGAFTLVCDHFLLWLEAMRAAGDNITPSGFDLGLAALGPNYLSSRVHATDFSDGRQSGAVDFATGVFNDTCQCFVRQTAWAPTT